ncbi:MAG: glycosyltransferase, partial [Acidimicrobiales bacterium]
MTTIRLPRVFRNQLKHQKWFGATVMPLLVAGRFDAVHSMMPQDALASCRTSRLTGHRVVYEEMGIPWRWYWDTLPDRDLRLWLVDRVDVYGCMSQHALDVMEKELGRRGTLIPGGVRLSEFAPAEQREKRPTILFSGALGERHKGLGDLLQAVELLLAEIPDLQVWVSGQGDPGSIIAEAPPAARAATQVLALGSPTEQGRRYARAWATALPSQGDSFGLVLIESLASGTPIVVADDAAPPSLVTPETGTIAPLHDPAALADALRGALDLATRPETAARCRESAERYDWDGAIAPLLEEIYSGVPAHGRASPLPASGATPEVSVVISSYRRPDRLERLLRSLAEQTMAAGSFEVLAVDNASEDGTGEVLDRLAAELPYKLLPLATFANRGPAPARNLGWHHSAAPLVAFTDDDCVPEPGWLEAGAAARQADPRLGIVQG